MAGFECLGWNVILPQFVDRQFSSSRSVSVAPVPRNVNPLARKVVCSSEPVAHWGKQLSQWVQEAIGTHNVRSKSRIDRARAKGSRLNIQESVVRIKMIQETKDYQEDLGRKIWESGQMERNSSVDEEQIRQAR